jgi:hypothetical protein
MLIYLRLYKENMGKVKIRKKDISSVHRMMDIILILLGLLTVMILAFGGPLKYNAMVGLYGPMAPLFIVVFVIIIILLYLKINEN